MNKILFYFKNVIFRKYSIANYKKLEKNLKLSTEELDAIKLEKLIKIFIFAKKNVPYYEKAFKDIYISDIKSIRDLEKLPVLTKEDVRNNFKDLIAKNVSKKYLNKVTTGGSTGAPLTVYHDNRFPIEVIGWRVLTWWKVNPSDNIAFIYRKVRTGWRENINSLIWYPTKRIFLDASLMNPESMHLFYKKILITKPKIIQGYVGAVFEFAKFCQKNKYELDFLSVIWVTSAPLSESYRKFMEDVYGVPVYDQYGCGEVYWLAAECDNKEGLHVFSDVRTIEIIDKNNLNMPNGEYGEVAITDLENFAFPLIRYKNGDRGRYLNKQCSCGIPLPLMDKIKGRVTDTIKLPSGSIIAGDFLTTIFDNFPDAVYEFQIYQYKNYSLCLYCVPGKAKDYEDICKKQVLILEKLTSSEVLIDLKFVDSISHDQGKTRFIISEVK